MKTFKFNVFIEGSVKEICAVGNDYNEAAFYLINLGAKILGRPVEII